MKIVDLFFDAANDVVDSYFVQTDLKDINLTNEERTQTAMFDRLAEKTKNDKKRDHRPIGKQVW